ncbi:MAG: sigma-70 family RNA polymerase sigma factor [Streptosporangiales bacterium]|nr:sigma-70 family RNA polymerase sigma factor [Streptosporangiales bacterium]
MDGQDDIEALARRAAAGDRPALDSLLQAIQRDVMRRCSRFLPYQQDAEEACQDTLLKVAQNITRFEGRSKFTTWLYTVTANCARQTYRSLKRRAAEQTSEFQMENPDPRRTSVVAGSRLDLLEALDKLEDTRADLVEPIVLRDVVQMDYNEIAGHLGIPLGTVKSRIHDARAFVREQLGDSSVK